MYEVAAHRSAGQPYRSHSARYAATPPARLPYTIAAANGATMMFQSLRAASCIDEREKHAT